VHEAVEDPVVRRWVEEWWDDAARHLPLPAEDITSYRAALLDLYRNPRIRHLLAQIAADGSQKIPIRILPTLRAALADGYVARGATRAVAAWTLHLLGRGAPLQDLGAAEVLTAVAGRSVEDAAATVLDRLGVRDEAVRHVVAEQARELCDRS
jgi:fructuronate reductase